MTDQELIQKIQGLKQIKPRSDWVILTKNRIIGEEKGPKIELTPFFLFSPKVLVPVSLALAFGIFFLSQLSLPGERLYPVKKIAETGQGALVVPEKKKPEFYLNLAEKRAEELKEVMATKQIVKLASAVKEYQESLKQAKQAIENYTTSTAPTEPEQVIVIAQKVNQLSQKNEELEKDLDVAFGDAGELKEKTLACLKGEIENTKNKLSILIEQEIQRLENSQLTESQQALLEEIKQLIENGDYSAALEKILLFKEKN